MSCRNIEQFGVAEAVGVDVGEVRLKRGELDCQAELLGLCLEVMRKPWAFISGGTWPDLSLARWDRGWTDRGLGRKSVSFISQVPKDGN